MIIALYTTVFYKIIGHDDLNDKFCHFLMKMFQPFSF